MPSDKDAPNIKAGPPGPKVREILEKEKKFLAPSIAEHFPIVWDQAKGAVVKDVDGNLYIDFTSGIVVANVGHCHPRVVSAVQDQAAKLIHCYDFSNLPRLKLLEKIAEITPGRLKKTLPVTGGSEAVEVSIKLARYYTKRDEILSFHGGFHGRASYMALTLTSEEKYKKRLGTLMSGVYHAPYAYCYRCAFEKTYPECDMLCARYLSRVIQLESSGDIAALILEPIQGLGGYVVPPDEFLPYIREFCSERDILLIADEIQSGLGRSGKMFAIEHWGVEPDILLAGKAMGDGLPINCVISREDIMNKWEPGEHSSTHGGNPLCCAAALATIEVILDEKLCENACRVGDYVLKRLHEMEKDYEIIGEVRGKGLMIAIEFVKDRITKKPATGEVRKIMQKAFNNGFLILPAGWWKHVLKITPPLVITQELAEKGLEILEDAIKSVKH